MDRDTFEISSPSDFSIDQLLMLTRTVEARDARPRAALHPATRHPPVVKAILRHGKAFWVCPDVHKLGTACAVVQLGGAKPPEGTVLELTLKCRYEGRYVEHRIDVTVILLAPDRAELVFGAYDNRVYTDLVKLAYAV